jgi:predicted dienelactone hydrolase
VISVTACSPSGPGAVTVAPSPARDGRDGADGPFGASRVTVLTQARVYERVTIEVTFPSDATGNLRRDRAPFPTVVFAAGGLVTSARYRWIADHIATRGFVVVAPDYTLDLAIASPDNTNAALLAVRRAAQTAGHTLEGAIRSDGKVAAMGHSLGSVIATWQWADYNYDGVVLIAGLPADGSRLERRAGSRVLSITGSQDGSALLPDVTRGFLSFSRPRMLAVVEGMNHYDWTDGATAANLARDMPSTRPQSATRRDGMRVIDTYLDAVLRGDAAATAALDNGAFEGVTVTR